jgi:hypothetical protein
LGGEDLSAAVAATTDNEPVDFIDLAERDGDGTAVATGGAERVVDAVLDDDVIGESRPQFSNGRWLKVHIGHLNGITALV